VTRRRARRPAPAGAGGCQAGAVPRDAGLAMITLG
jgi:hypothetical protein